MCVHVYGTIYSISTVEGSEGSVVCTGTCISNKISAFRVLYGYRNNNKFQISFLFYQLLSRDYKF